MVPVLNLLLIDNVESLPDWTEEQVVAEWFGPLRPEGGAVRVSAVAASDPACARRAADSDAVILTGSSRDAHSEEPVILTLCETLRHLTAVDKPILGICFGHQILARALGAQVGRSPSGWEVGTVRIQLTAEGLACPVLTDLGPEPDVLQSHQDAVLTLPLGALLLAGNAHTPIQAFQSRSGGRQFGVQFHPEFTPERLQKNWTQRRIDWQGRTSFDLDAALDQARPTPHTASLFTRFFELAAGSVS